MGRAAAGRPDWVDSALDLIATPAPARVVNALVGGYHNFEADRDLADEMRQAWPGYVPLVWAQKAFAGRVVAWLTAQGIRQVLDVGCGLPVIGAVHGTAGPDTRIVYADLDPIVVSLIRDTLADHRHVEVVQGDLRQPGSILDHHITQTHLDFSQPVAVLLTGVLPHVADLDDPAGIIAQIREAVVAGSYLAVSHLAPVATIQCEQERICRLYDRTPTPVCLRTGPQLADLMAGWELVEPGIVPVTDWHPEPDLNREPPTKTAMLGAVARARNPTGPGPLRQRRPATGPPLCPPSPEREGCWDGLMWTDVDESDGTGTSDEVDRARYASQLAEWRNIMAGYPMTGDRDEEEFRRDVRVILAAKAMEPRGWVEPPLCPLPPELAEAAAGARPQRRSLRLSRIRLARIWRRLIERAD